METTAKTEDSDNQATCTNVKKEDALLSQSGLPISEAKSSTDSRNVQVRIVRGTKKMRVDSGDGIQINEKKELKEDDNAEAKIVKSLKRSCELWSMEDKNTFFKAINEFGKDFDAMQSYFLSQGKKRGLSDNMIKNKEQIRHFYYRTWLKISKHLKFSDDVKKASQELYGLINYGELRRKLPRIHEKVHLKLNELVYWGSTQVRLRGKTMRIKTPICRALRKLNQLEDWQEEIKLPPRVMIELRPGNNMAWWQVQANAMNPRVRTLVPIQRRLSSILIFLQQRWRPVKYRTCTNIDQINGESKDTRLLRVAPPDGCKIALPAVNLGEYLTSNSVSLNSHEKRFGLKSSRVELLGTVQHLKSVGKKGIKRSKIDKRIPNKTDDQLIAPDNNSDLDIAEPGLSVSEKPSVVSNIEKSTSEQVCEPNRFPGRETINRIKLGWTVKEANTITVGDLFLMFGRDSKISLEYWWDSSPREDLSSSEKLKVISTTHDNSLCLALQKLLSIARHSYGTSKGYDNTSGSNETVISSRIPSTKESTFRRPLIPQAYHRIGGPDAFKTQLDKFKTRFCKKGRTVRQRSLVVQRVLPLVSDAAVPLEKSAPSETVDILNSTIRESSKAPESETNGSQDKHFLEVLAVGDQAKPSNSIITSATQILKEGEHQWLNSEVADFSLSSFLGQLDSPIKVSQRSHIGAHSVDDIRPSSDVISQMQGLMGENSVDYMAKFANLASQIACDEHRK
ncbi:protein cramped isoform X1 [Orussus abietinus]|uniref:protein cramped isoform X1 n=1 Tax=Orussus abietinus TaxID=222816 RepID=UPI0006257542|nr:protein cramped isoform X1 [Orussus abietinus]XP_012279768.1 protein cramped isoform X1 [Orussus abietinus]XP_012279769.1 protein cramped isoform X1 [Orussus abietinus]